MVGNVWDQKVILTEILLCLLAHFIDRDTHFCLHWFDLIEVFEVERKLCHLDRGLLALMGRDDVNIALCPLNLLCARVSASSTYT